MVSVFFAALFALLAPGDPPGPAPLDLSCYRLMAELAADDDPRISEAGTTGAQYFLGRIDARAPGFDPDAAEIDRGAEGDREQLITRCGALMGAAGRDFRALGQRLVRPRATV
jgi:hypothetical protein